MKSIAEEIGDLRLLDTAGLVERYEALFGRPPRTKNRDHLWRRCAWKLQERRFGGLSTVAKRRLEELAGEVELPIETPVREIARKNGDLTPGTVLAREWRGQRVEVRVLDEGFEWNGFVYRSLSAVACAVTNQHWSGALFFGLRQRKRA